MPTIREEIEAREKTCLAPWAMQSAESKGRAVHEERHFCRTEYQRDRDRILHCKSFRRLKHKTQVFLSPEGDHYRTRLTHTLEVSQIARTVARALKLNEDLAEAIALGHDLGHTPFGHAGEAVLDKVYADGFDHHEQSLRVVDVLEAGYGRGLNLTWEVRDGILNHHKGKSLVEAGVDRGGKPLPYPATCEGEVIRWADAVAYINHDIDDACRAGVISLDDLPAGTLEIVGRRHSERIDTMVSSLITYSGDGKIGMEPEMLECVDTLRTFLYSEVYPRPVIHDEIAKAKKLLEEIYQYVLEHADRYLPESQRDESAERLAVDFVAGMTDRYALSFYEREFLPHPWRGD
jgi:dGTPase